MTWKRSMRIALAFALSSTCMFGQTVASSLVGTVVDPADAAVANTPVTLTNTATGVVRTATTDNTGTYRFLNIDPASYTLTVKAPGFKATTQTGIDVAASETHNGGRLVLQLGNVQESVSVTAEVAQVQLASAELSRTVDAASREPDAQGPRSFRIHEARAGRYRYQLAGP